MEKQLMRIGISLPGSLLETFDDIIYNRGYSSRSEGIRDAIRSYNQHYEWMQDIKGKRAATISIVYDCSKKGVNNALENVQHQYTDMILSTVRIHLDLPLCFEVIILEGDGERIVELAEKILSQKGVRFSKLMTVPPARTGGEGTKEA
ncbi:MAG: nickel-responsive transcriptional regulator NikR [Methanosarcinaceae archaeon]|nr:nickel-responsive transcriptional regulator NikR [Methanosarcinaceae archaeon]MDD4497730.1 nickel-responsive transcriptional regulator NikR [Methanosarcinaceae archaeon]